MTKFYLLILLIFLSALPSLAQGLADYRIVDEYGLIRAFKRGATHPSVEIKLVGKSSEALILENIDGLSVLKESRIGPSGLVVFNDVKPGTWSIKLPSGELVIEWVKFQ